MTPISAIWIALDRRRRALDACGVGCDPRTVVKERAAAKEDRSMSTEQLTGFEDYIVRNRLVPAKCAPYHRL